VEDSCRRLRIWQAGNYRRNRNGADSQRLALISYLERVVTSVRLTKRNRPEASGIQCRGDQRLLPAKAPTACALVMGAGAWQYAGMAGYTSRGAGTSLLPVRLNCPPEITLHTLRFDRGKTNRQAFWIKTAHKLPAQFGSSDWQPFANHPTDRANTSNESKIVLAHIPASQPGEGERRS